MKSKSFRQVEAAIGGMTAEELSDIQKAIQNREGQVECSLVVRERSATIKNCPHCGFKASKWGAKDGVPRFKCGNLAKDPMGVKRCGKTFNALTGTPLAGLHQSNKHILNAKCMLDGLTVRETAKKLGVDKDTAFRWRHRFLANFAMHQPKILSGLVEADETFFLESFKGKRKLPAGRVPKKRGMPAKQRGLSKEQIPVLVARNRATGETLSIVVASRTAKHIGVELIPRLAPDSELISDGARAYKTLARDHQIDLRIVPANKKHKTVGSLHINNVNAFDARLKGWMHRFRGVATRYLPNYLGWHRWLDATRKSKNARKRFLAYAIRDRIVE